MKEKVEKDSILFMDIGGVVAHPFRHESWVFDLACVERLNRIVEVANPKVVLTHPCRIHTPLPLIRKLFKKNFYRGTIDDVTIRAEPVQYPAIAAYLRLNGLPTRFIIVSDIEPIEEFAPYSIVTDPAGLTDDDVPRIIARLMGLV